MNDAVLALIALGWKQADAEKAARAIHTSMPAAKTDEIVRAALKLLLG